MNRVLRFFLLGICLGLGLWLTLISCFSGCGRVVSNPSASSAVTETITQEITASSGGVITFSDGSSVSFPAGALPSNLSVVATRLGSNNFPDQLLSAIHVTSMEGLADPATVVLKYDPARVGADSDIVVGIVGGATSQETVSSAEVSVARFVSPESIDEANGTMTIKTSHFSWVWAFCQAKSYLVFDFTEFMYGVVKPGDILFALTGAHGFRAGMSDGSWLPGHVGLYVGTEETGAMPGYQDIIESTVAKVAGGSNGVQRSNSFNFKNIEHIFLGARTPKAYNLTEANRTYLVTQAKKMLGWPYFYIDFDNTGIPLASGLLAGPTVGITCVGFVEKAYEDADLDPLVSAVRQYVFFPIELYTKTKPVTDITVSADQGVEFYVYGVVRNNFLTYAKWRTYLDQPDYYSLSASSSNLNIRTVTFPASNEAQVYSAGRTPHFVSVVGSGNLTYGSHDYPYFYWVPSSAEAGQTYNVTFTLDAGANGTKTETINITVNPM